MKTALTDDPRINLTCVPDDQLDTISTTVLYAGERLEAVRVRVYTPVSPKTQGIPGYRVLVLCDANGSDISRSATPITEGEHYRLLDLRPGFRHTAMIWLCGGEDLIKPV
ncbi:hypothetical protein [Thiolapillus sp.]|uniref:hypothetical protein n=1 Tax=Thiolapillus sp. TaxID=2017437 RepID=UPI003AF7085A